MTTDPLPELPPQSRMSIGLMTKRSEIAASSSYRTDYEKR